MNKETMQNMTAEELEGYAQSMGFTLRACKDKSDKIALIQRKRARAVTIEVLGLELSVEVRKFRGSKFSDVVNKRDRTSAELMDAFRGLLGDTQYESLLAACAEEDGEGVDEDALAYAFVRILQSDELKNY